jgi:hypothetical protein
MLSIVLHVGHKYCFTLDVSVYVAQAAKSARTPEVRGSKQPLKHGFLTFRAVCIRFEALSLTHVCGTLHVCVLFISQLRRKLVLTRDKLKMGQVGNG